NRHRVSIAFFGLDLIWVFCFTFASNRDEIIFLFGRLRVPSPTLFPYTTLFRSAVNSNLLVDNLVVDVLEVLNNRCWNIDNNAVSLDNIAIGIYSRLVKVRVGTVSIRS